MSAEQDRVRQMAERIARRVSQDEGVEEARGSQVENGAGVGNELAAVRASLEDLQRRLVQIESHVTRKSEGASQTERRTQSREEESGQRQSSQTGRAFQNGQASSGVRSPWLSGMYVPAAAHPSQERFGVEEATI